MPLGYQNKKEKSPDPDMKKSMSKMKSNKSSKVIKMSKMGSSGKQSFAPESTSHSMGGALGEDTKDEKNATGAIMQ